MRDNTTVNNLGVLSVVSTLFVVVHDAFVALLHVVLAPVVRLALFEGVFHAIGVCRAIGEEDELVAFGIVVVDCVRKLVLLD